MSLLRLRRQGLHWLESDGEIVALDDVSLRYLSANAPGAVLWQRLVQGATRDQLVAALLDEFEVDPADARRDVDAYVTELTRLGLLES